MRHATDPDHVVAVTTIVSQQRSLARAARTGVLWGIGHTATILLVGGAIVVLKVQLGQIPPRVGLSLELAVAVMLIVLGLLTLAGNDRRVIGEHGASGDDRLRPRAGRIGGGGDAAAGGADPRPVVGGGLSRACSASGTIAGMMLVTVSIAAPSLLALRRFAGHEPYAAHRVGSGEHRLRAVAGAPHRLRGRAVHQRRRRGSRTELAGPGVRGAAPTRGQRRRRTARRSRRSW